MTIRRRVESVSPCASTSARVGRVVAAAAAVAIAACDLPPGELEPGGVPVPMASGDAGAAELGPTWPPQTELAPAFEVPPWLTLPAPDRVVVSWRTGVDTTGWVLAYPADAPDSGRIVVAEDTAARQHHTALAPLLPGTAYRYRIVVADVGAVHDGVFVTPGRDRWRFVHLAEFHAPTDVAQASAFSGVIRAFGPQLVIESGDMVDTGGQMTQWISYFDASAAWISNVITLPAHSNHVNGTGGNANVADLFVLPGNGRWYETRYGQVQVFTLDSTYDRSDNLDTLNEQILWLADRAAASRDGIDDPLLRIGAWHYPACSSRYKGRAGSRTWVREHFVDTIAAAGGFELFLVGHDKYYERSVVRSAVGAGAELETVHVMSNVGKLAPSTRSDPEPACTPRVTHTATRSIILGEVDGDTIRGTAVDANGLVLDTFEVTAR